ncbi:MAG: Aerobic respiration control sensor protein ArcB [Paracidovorax wautersii]|uniref:histidine kinase n=1 Tax=Paracidovorax wautersii TaxID=1177982 RepID=A0A7V8FL21_9BURK|nr:MAG: Aerobic respiration control sensor protein ArcB [Paracidovorax wautersii]
MKLLHRPHPFWTLVVILSSMALAMLAAAHFAQARALQVESDSIHRQLELYAQSLQQRIDRYRTLPQLLALDPELHEAVTRPLSAADVSRLNAKLERANGASQSSTLTLIDARGTALAASNWRDPRSNVGVDYSFRPYVQQALAQGKGDFYGIGLTTGEPGYFLSQAIEDTQGRVLGIVVIKIILAALEREWLTTPDVVLVSDRHGVVFLASRGEWRYRLLQPLSAAQREHLQATRQYANQPLLPTRYERDEPIGNGGALARIDEPPLAGHILWQTLQLPDTGWHVHLLHDTSATTAAGRAAALAAGGLWLALSLLVLFVQQRRRLSALRQRSRQELETALQQHARELRTAQDGIVQAAKSADTGLSRSLAHLPQGVVVIDADLNLVAWNARYLELFRFPPELVQVGRPIEALFRYNARRGLLGPGPVDEAIARRLNHLRSGKAHVRESEKEDGTVLEIRGNPLPDGGFVTSYADITSYKNAARELRSLADALEHRIAERTSDLDLARHEAEKANRSKTRFVAAAVHDLLQPLNAARMFLSVQRSHLHDDVSRQYADHIDHALAAQDAILTSLLDIARMESGQWPVQIRDFPLAPLMETLQREFGLLAASHGLTLRGQIPRYTVRSDEALLRRILQNFLSNAIRYTRHGRILLGCRRDGDHLRIEVHDQGPGIPESLLGEIFEEFRRLNEGQGADRGAGLGLAIVERIGRRLEHPIGVASQLGRGSVFWVRVPLGDPAATVAAPAPAVVPDAPETDMPLRGCSSWCIDDDPRACEAMQALLARWGCAVPYAGGPQQALALAMPNQAPDVVLLDVRMGAVHGPDLYPQLCERWGQSPPVILVTAERDDALKRQAADQGWGFLAKPVRPPALRALMSQMLLRHR